MEGTNGPGGTKGWNWKGGTGRSPCLVLGRKPCKGARPALARRDITSQALFALESWAVARSTGALDRAVVVGAPGGACDGTCDLTEPRRETERTGHRALGTGQRQEGGGQQDFDSDRDTRTDADPRGKGDEGTGPIIARQDTNGLLVP